MYRRCAVGAESWSLAFGRGAELFVVDWGLVCEFETLRSLSGAVELAVMMRVRGFLPNHFGQHFVSSRMECQTLVLGNAWD